MSRNFISLIDIFSNYCYNALIGGDFIKTDRLHNIWRCMVGRCSGKWKNYFDMTYYYNKGITVCPEWRESFNNFYDWAIANGYQEGLSIDRINPDGNYEPANCRWIPLNMNKGLARKHPRIYVNYNGRSISIMELSKESGIPYATLLYRIRKKNIVPEKAVSMGTRKKGECNDNQ